MSTSPHSTCWLLIEKAAAGEQKHREEFASRYEEPIRAYLMARWRQPRRSHDVDDAVQEVFLACYREGGVLVRADRERLGGFRAFLYGVARNVARRAEERAARNRERPSPSGIDLEEIETDEETLSLVFDRAWVKSLLREAFSLLTENAVNGDEAAARRVDLLRRRFEDDQPVRDIAREWGVDAKALHRDFDRAKKEFRAAFAEVVAFHFPGTPGEIQARCAELLAFAQ